MNNLTFNEFQQNCLKLLSPQCTVTKETQLINSLMGLAGEVGELTDLVKKHLFHDHPLDFDKARKELGDVQFYVAEAADALDSTLQEIAQMNVDKLAKRYPSGFTVEDSLAKRDQELEANKVFRGLKS